MLPFCDPVVAGMELALRYRCPSPLGGESTSNLFSDNAYNCSKFKYENFVLILLDGIPSVARQKCTFTMKGYTGEPTFRKSYEHTNGIKENTVWCMMKKKSDRKKALETKIDSSFNVQNIMVNKIISYIEVLCHNKSVSYDTDTNHHSYQLPMFTSMHSKTLTCENGEHIYKHGETMLSYSILIKDDMEREITKEIILPSCSMHHINQLIFENYCEYQWYKMETSDV